jgi:2-haloacid dehalogenase
MAMGDPAPAPAGATPAIEAVVFDLGKVLVDWSPSYFYAPRFDGDAVALERFLREVVCPEWIAEMDAGKPAAQAIREHCARHPQAAQLIALWQEGWPQMLRGEIAGTVEILAELRARGFPLYALSNFSTEAYPVARARFSFLEWFDDVVISGEVGLVKPDPRIFELAIERCGLAPARTVFIDDMAANVAAARGCGFIALQFIDAERLRSDLRALEVLSGAAT